MLKVDLSVFHNFLPRNPNLINSPPFWVVILINLHYITRLLFKMENNNHMS